MIARLEIADLHRFARTADVFGGTGNLDCGNGLIVGFDDDVVVFDLPQHAGDAVDAAGWIVAAGSGSLPGLAALWIAPAAAGVGTATGAAWITAARIADTGNNDLAKSWDPGQD